MMKIFFLFTTVLFSLLCFYLWKKNKKLEAKIKLLEDTSFIQDKYFKANSTRDEIISIEKLSDTSFSLKKDDDDSFKKDVSLEEAPLRIEKIPQRKFSSLRTGIEEDLLENTSEAIYLDDFVYKRGKESVVPRVLEDEALSSEDYLEKLSNRLENELKPKTIELTDYEKKQEETAIISYQELISLKNDYDGTIKNDPNQQFLHDLKNFRNHLK